MILQPERSLLILSNIQDDLVPILHEGERVVSYCAWLAGVAREFGVPILLMEHKRLGATMPEIKRLTEGAPSAEIVSFSYLTDPKTRSSILDSGRDQIVLAGTETHISILQSAADAIDAGLRAYVVGEACSTRDVVDHAAALKRLPQLGAQVVTREMVFFEWLPSSEHPRYRDMSLRFVKHPTPPDAAAIAAAS